MVEMVFAQHQWLDFRWDRKFTHKNNSILQQLQKPVHFSWISHWQSRCSFEGRRGILSESSMSSTFRFNDSSRSTPSRTFSSMTTPLPRKTFETGAFLSIYSYFDNVRIDLISSVMRWRSAQSCAISAVQLFCLCTWIFSIFWFIMRISSATWHSFSIEYLIFPPFYACELKSGFHSGL